MRLLTRSPGSFFSLAATRLSENTGHGGSRISTEDRLKGLNSSDVKGESLGHLPCPRGQDSWAQVPALAQQAMRPGDADSPCQASASSPALSGLRFPLVLIIL